uniref:DM2 domain-containing protein n=1 Tax=Cebus imitator TaxID=2715852 RepID=A0A2K5S2R3_CEBIM
MTSFSTSAQCSTSDSACRISPGQTNQILHAAGAPGEMFTVKEVMHYLGQYILVKQAFMISRNKLLGCQSSSVKDPSPLYDMLRKNLVTLATATTDAAQTLALAQDHSVDIPSQDQLKQSAAESSTSRRRTAEDDIPTLPTSQHKYLSGDTETHHISSKISNNPLSSFILVTTLVLIKYILK